jgi:DNA-binding response OmpR family regulator
MMNTKVLYIEDEPYLARIVTETMELKGYKVMHKSDGLRVLEHITSFSPDICVLDVMLPHIDGFSLGSTIRNIYPKLPIIFLTAKSQTQDVLEGFSAGGTDYLKKPFSMEELMVRIDNQLKLLQNAQASSGELKDIPLGTLVYSPARLELQSGNRSIKLSNREAEILNLLCMHQNQTIDRRKLMQVVWGDDSYFISRNLDVYIRRLREYFAGSGTVEIITLKGKGYHFSVSQPG